MSFGFDNIKPTEKQYLKQAGLHENAKFIALTYGCTEQYEYLDIELETADGKYFRERTFGPSIDKVFPKDIWKDRVKVGVETKQQAFERVKSDINIKLFHLASCFTDKETLMSKVTGVRTLKELVDATNKAIGEPKNNINFLTVWKNSDMKRKSNLILASGKWVEPYTEGRAAGVRLSKWQLDNQTVEKYPYQGSNAAEGPIGSVDAVTEHAADDLPF